MMNDRKKTHRLMLACAAVTGLTLGFCAQQARADDSWSATITYQTSAQSGCDDTVASQMVQSQAANIASQTALAQQMHPFLDNAGLGAKACMNNLMNLIGVNGSFTPPSWSTIEQNLKNFACSVATSYVDSYKSQAQGLVSSYATSGVQKLGEIVPGVNLGAMPPIVQVQTGGTGLSTNLVDAVGQSKAEAVAIYQGIFGSD